MFSRIVLYHHRQFTAIMKRLTVIELKTYLRNPEDFVFTPINQRLIMQKENNAEFFKNANVHNGEGVFLPCERIRTREEEGGRGGSNKGQFYANVIIEGPLIKLVRHQFFFF